MATIDDINNSFAYDKQANYPGTSTQQQQGNAMVIGQFGRGNIDLYNRPQYKNPDGKISTVRSMSANIDGKEVLLPTVSKDQNGNPILLSNEEAIQRYKDTGEHLGIFDSVDEANRYAEALHQQQEKYYSTKNKAANHVTPATGGSMTFQDMYRQLNTYRPPTEEELEKERKKQKRDMLMASIGNGFNAFHQAYANARGIKPVTENVSLTGKVRDRYEKIQKERDALSREYANGMLRAAQMDQEQSNWREKLEYQKGRDAKADERDQRNFDYTKEQDKQKQENWQKTFDRQSEQWQQEFKQREQQYGRQNALAWASHNLAVQAQKDNKELREKSINAQAAKGVRGKQLAFTDGNGNNFNIYENVWKGSMEQVYDAIVAEFEAQKKNNSNADVPRGLPRKATAQQKDDFVKQHWHKSEAGRRMMQTLAGIDPASMVNTSGNYDQYEVKQDDYSQYEVK